MSEGVFDIRFIYYTPGIDLQSVIKRSDDLLDYSEKIQSFIEKCPGFISFIKDPANRRNAISYASGVGLLKNLLSDIGCKALMLSVAHLEGAITNRKTQARDELIERLPKDLERLCERLMNIPRVEPNSKTNTITGELTAASEAEQRRKKTIAVIDDEVSQLNATESLLEIWFDVHCLSRSEDYEKLLTAIMADLVILDVEMPILDGYQVLEGIRKLTAYAHTPVLLVTYHATPGNLNLAKEMGVNGFMRKPFDKDMLINKVTQLIAGAPLRQYKLTPPIA